jgi:hypothetical protein
MNVDKLITYLAQALGFVIWGLAIFLIIRVFIRARQRMKEKEESPQVPFPAYVLHLLPPLVLGGMFAYALKCGRSDRLGGLYGVAVAFAIIQLVIAGLFGLGRSILAVACTGIFVFVELLVAVAIFAMTQAS